MQRRPRPAEPDWLDPGGVAPVLWHRRTNGLIFFLKFPFFHISTSGLGQEHLLQLQQWSGRFTWGLRRSIQVFEPSCPPQCGVHIFAFTFAFTYFLSHIGLHIFALTYWPYLPETFTYLLSCCKPKDNELIKNKQCGYDVRKQDYVSTHHSSMLFYHNIRLKIIILIIPGKSYIINLLLVN